MRRGERQTLEIESYIVDPKKRGGLKKAWIYKNSIDFFKNYEIFFAVTALGCGKLES